MNKTAPEATRLEDKSQRPASIEAERTILGCLLLDEEHYWDAADEIEYGDFCLQSHRQIWAAISTLMEGGINLDIITLSEELDRRNELSSIGNRAYLFSLTENLPRKLRIAEYLKIVKEKAKLRLIMGICSSAITLAVDQNTPSEDLLAKLQGDALEASTGGSAAFHVRDIVPGVLDRIQKQMHAPHDTVALGLTTGIQELDSKTKGLFPAEFSIMAAESSGGKSATAMQTTIANALLGVPVLWFSLEMTKDQLGARMFSSYSEEFTASSIRDPRGLSMFQVPMLKEVEQELGSLPIWIDDSSSLTLEKLVARTRVMVRQHGIKLVIVDYIQLLKADGKDRVAMVENIAFGLRDLAKMEKTIHVIGLSQYSRDTSVGKNKRSNRGRLKGSSSIEQAAQNIFLINIDEAEDNETVVDAEISVDKSREGKKGRVKLRFDTEHLKFIGPRPYHDEG